MNKVNVLYVHIVTKSTQDVLMVGICGIPLNKGHMLVTACQTTPNYSKTKDLVW